MNPKFLPFCIVFIYALATHVSAQEVSINGEPERPLIWDDFKGKPDKSSPFFAETYWNLDFTSTGLIMDGENISPKSVVLRLKFNDKKSWLKNGKGTDELLKHEQGHFDIARFCQLEIMATLKMTILTKANFQVKVQVVFDTTFEKYRRLEKKYDEETDHSANKEKQAEWNNFLLAEKQRLLKLNE